MTNSNMPNQIQKTMKWKILLLPIILVTIISCDNIKTPHYNFPESGEVPSVNIPVDSIIVDGDTGEFSVDITQTIQEKGVSLVNFAFTSAKPAELKPVSIKYRFKSIDINGYWNPKITVDKVNYYSSGVTSKASRNAPVLSFYNDDLQNRITIALSDALNKSEIVSYLKEEDVCFHHYIKLFTEKMPLTTHYEITLRIDTRNIPYYKSIDDVSTWWANEIGYTPMNVPDDAKKPMYSTWYSYHQNVSAESIIKECEIASTLGCKAVIVDDGWQTLDGNRGYRFTGDWEPERIPDMKSMVEGVHNTGMKILLWYSLPFIGEKAKNYPRFKGKYLKYWESQGAYILDPRYPEVREFIVGNYVDALKNWDLDGFKLDFIGWFSASEDTELTMEDGRDFASVNNATDALMTDIKTRLTEINNDLMIEFRQPYIGPVMRKFGNMFRGVDCPNNAVANRIETTNLRILSQNTAVHSDMFIWRKEDPVEKAALQILNIMYSVPQLSVKLEEVPEEHLNMIRYWFDYWNANRDVLLDGEFIPSNPSANYPVLTAVSDGHQITSVYENMVVNIYENIEKLDIINAKSENSVVFNLGSKKGGRLVIKDCMGNVIYNDEAKYKKGVNQVNIPASGMARFIFN